jgi:hypothetical protein
MPGVSMLEPLSLIVGGSASQRFEVDAQLESVRRGGREASISPAPNSGERRNARLH